MAIIYTTGTINQPDAGSVGQSMVEKIRDDVSAHAAWDVIDEYTAASGTVRWYVLKCLASLSGLPNDMYVVMCRTLSNGRIDIFSCEGYNATSHIASYWAPQGYSSQYTFDASGRFASPPDFTLGTNPPSGNTTPMTWYWVPSGTSTKWWIAVDNDGFTVAFNGPSNAYFHVGAFIPFATMPFTVPWITMGYNGGLGAAGGLCRNPGIANINYNAAGLYAYCGGGTSGGSNGSIGNAPLLGFPSDLRYNDKINGGQRPVAEVGMTMVNYNTGDQTICGYALGKMKRIRATDKNVPAGMAFGDAYVLSNRLWVPYNPTDNRMWDTGVASS